MRKKSDHDRVASSFADFSAADANELLSRARRLDSFALGELHDRYYPEIYRYLIFRLGDEQTCQDLAADVFINFLEALKRRSAPRHNLSVWLFKTAARLADEHLTEAAKKSRRSLATIMQGSAEASHHQLRLRRALWRLSFDQQHFLGLRFSLEHSLEEIAGLLGKPVEEAREMQFRALATLSRFLEEGE